MSLLHLNIGKASTLPHACHHHIPHVITYNKSLTYAHLTELACIQIRVPHTLIWWHLETTLIHCYTLGGHMSLPIPLNKPNIMRAYLKHARASLNQERMNHPNMFIKITSTSGLNG